MPMPDESEPGILSRLGSYLLDFIRDIRVYLLVIALIALASTVQAHSAHKDTQKTLNFLVSCTTPGPTHNCYTDSQKNEALLLDRLNQTVIDAATCATQVRGEVAIKNCVDQLLEAQGLPDAVSVP